MVPGRKFSITTSAVAASRRKSAAPPLVLEVQRDAPLVARVVEPPVGVARLARGAEPPQIVAGARALDLDDVGAELRETGGGERGGDEGGGVEHPDVVERHDRSCHQACSRMVGAAMRSARAGAAMRP